MKKKVIIIGAVVFLILVIVIIKNRNDRLSQKNASNSGVEAEAVMNYDEETRIVLCN